MLQEPSKQRGIKKTKAKGKLFGKVQFAKSRSKRSA